MDTLIELIKNRKELRNNMGVKLPTGEKAYIYGFIPYNNSPFGNNLACPSLGMATVVGNRCIDYIGGVLHRFPIFKSVRTTLRDKYHVFLLYVPRMFELEPNLSKCYIESMRNKDRYDFNISKIEDISIIDSKPYFTPLDNEFEFLNSGYSDTPGLKGIGNGFVVITYRSLPERGETIYEIYDGRDVQINDEVHSISPFAEVEL